MRGKRGDRGVHAVAEGADEPVPDRRRCTRLPIPTSTTSRSRACSTSARTSSRRSAATPTFKSRYAIGTVNSINWARVAAQVVYYFKGYFAVAATRRRSGRLRRAVGQFRQHPRRPRREADGPADPPPDPRHQRKRRAGRVLPHRPLPAADVGGDACDVEPVDGHLEGVELRALRVRRGRTRSAVLREPVGADRQRRRLRSRGDAALARRSRRRASFPARARMPIGSPRSAAAFARHHVIVDPHTADGVHVGRLNRDRGRPARLHRDGSAGEVRGDDPRSARAASRTARPPTPISRADRSISPCCRRTPSA